MSASRLAVDLSGASLRVLEGVPGGLMRCGESAPPPGSMDRGRVVDPALLGQALRQLVARTEITAGRALIAASDAIASFRVLSFAPGTADQDIEAELKRQLPQESDRMSRRRTDLLQGGGRQRRRECRPLGRGMDPDLAVPCRPAAASSLPRLREGPDR